MKMCALQSSMQNISLKSIEAQGIIVERFSSNISNTRKGVSTGCSDNEKLVEK